MKLMLLACSTVMDALKKVDPDRRCFRMVGGVLVERTVKDVVPALKYNSDQVRRSVSGEVGSKGVVVLMSMARCAFPGTVVWLK